MVDIIIGKKIRSWHEVSLMVVYGKLNIAHILIEMSQPLSLTIKFSICSIHRFRRDDFFLHILLSEDGLYHLLRQNLKYLQGTTGNPTYVWAYSCQTRRERSIDFKFSIWKHFLLPHYKFENKLFRTLFLVHPPQSVEIM